MSQVFSRFRQIVLVGCLSLVAGCGWFGGGGPKIDENATPEQVLGLAEAQVAANKPRKAGELFLEVERLFPYTDASRYALIQAARAFHDSSDLIESRAAAQRYLALYPNTGEAAEAQYLVALSYYDQIVDVRRDQRNSFNALEEFAVLFEEFPNSRYVELAKPKWSVAMNQLAGKEMDVGRYYLRRGHFHSAIKRFKAVIEEYTQTNQVPEAYYRLVEAYLSLGLDSAAGQAASTLIAKFPDNEWAAAANQLLTTGQTARPASSGGGRGFFGRLFGG